MNETIYPTAAEHGAVAMSDPGLDAGELIAGEMRLIRDEFVIGLPDRLRRIEDAWQHTQTAPDSASDLALLHRLVHSLTGASATLGFAALSSTARGLEHYLLSIINMGYPLPLDQGTQVDIWLHILKRVAGECAPDLVGGGVQAA